MGTTAHDLLGEGYVGLHGGPTPRIAWSERIFERPVDEV
jgi:hypothetical protein